ncbi:D-2-hydroxyacid dehydrogenase [Bauldia sp.]|uniref:D-2-hydroxyacid dehydrogenase n=1 Tax=Bauldia sp. TaxID=2575872 RepID=UPI003BA94325
MSRVMTPTIIERVVTNIDWPAEHWARLETALRPATLTRVDAGDGNALMTALQDADVALVDTRIDPAALAGTRLRWVHGDRSGLDAIATPAVLDSGVIITSSAGRSAPVLAEHALFFMLALAYRASSFFIAQRSRQWGIDGMWALRGLYGRTIGIVGLGHVGAALAVRAKALGMHVLGFRRSEDVPDGVDELFSEARGETIAPLLQRSDFLVLTLPLTDRTERLIGEAELKAMKPGAYLINVARGAIVDEAALIAALEARTLGGAGLDVFTQEPLPTDSRLWRAPNTIITPHFTPLMPDRADRVLEIILDNIERYRRGAPLRNRLTSDDIYSGGDKASAARP